MARFNRTFYDLNHERHYCFAMPGEEIPIAVLSDLKLSVPNDTEEPFIASIFLKGETVKLTIAVSGQIVASYSSEIRSMLRPGRTYTMKSWKKGYEGVLVFGNLKEDAYYTGNIPISEECLTRFLPSAMTHVSIPCTDIWLTGEVHLGGDGVQTRSFVESLPAERADLPESMILGLVDTGMPEASNPMILYANGANAFNEVAGMPSPIYSIDGVRPDAKGTVTLEFENHFRIAAVVEHVLVPCESGTEAWEEVRAVKIDEVAVSKLAVGTNLTQEEVCNKSSWGPPDENEKEPECSIEFEEINYA